MSSVCDPLVIKSLIDTKEFRILSTPIWREVQTNTNLSIESRFFWTVLWELCAPDERFEKTLTWGFLSKRIGKSESTIRRWARQLQKFGFLKITERYSNDGSQLPSVFRVGIPSADAKKLMMTFPNRKVRQTETGSEQSGISERLVENSGRASAVTRQDKSSDCRENIQTDQSCAPVSEQRSEIIEMKPKAENPSDISDSNPKSGVLSSAPETKSSLIEKLERLQKRAQSRTSDGKASSDTQVAVYTDRRSDAITEGRAKAVKMAEKRVGEGVSHPVQPRVADLASKVVTKIQDNNNNTHFRGEGLRRWIQRELESRQVRLNDLWRYVEEFAVSIEKGSLRKFSPTKAINVALKLVREGRWTAPRYVP